MEGKWAPPWRSMHGFFSIRNPKTCRENQPADFNPFNASKNSNLRVILPRIMVESEQSKNVPFIILNDKIYLSYHNN